MRRMLPFLLLLALVCPVSAVAQEPPTAHEIVARSQVAFHYAGDDMRARVTMHLIDREGHTRTRVMTMLRRDVAEGGKQKYFIYFHEPGDVRRMTFMVWKHPEKEDERWIFVPAVDLVRRIAADDKRSSFVGSDFTYEDISGRDPVDDTHVLKGEEVLDGRDCFVVESTPKDAVEFTRRVSWIDKVSFLPLKEEYYDRQGELYRVFSANEVKDVGAEGGTAYPTVVHRIMRNVKTGHRTEVVFEFVAYDLGLADADFSERRMRRPPAAWVR